jgi:hypothetical protein
MRDFHKYEFERLPFAIMLGDNYDNYWLQPLRHKQTGKTIDVLLDETGMLVKTANDITDKIRSNYYLDGEHAKVVAIKINGHQCLTIKFPTILII